ncbi:Cell wall protein PRY3 [Pseudolycoriella hygida]|uniref:Cell wall protein PRY3 n=1 Tax=Pseudolycoriella hygida TaxID=35572 RepID=A0A9Q0N6M3_9DIPT|nr:Cell wall protein PRY3 [Pseudolycoriella hygida]
MNKLIGLLALICVLSAILHTCQAQQGYMVRALNLHNQYRRRHHAPALRMDNQLNSMAVNCANYYIRRGRNDHSCPFKGSAGENLSGGSGLRDKDQFAVTTTNMWYDEVKVYNYNRPGFSLQTGHFTQVVWKSSRNFGFGCAYGNGKTVCAGLYSPPGNYPGQFRENVLRP